MFKELSFSIMRLVFTPGVGGNNDNGKALFVSFPSLRLFFGLLRLFIYDGFVLGAGMGELDVAPCHVACTASIRSLVAWFRSWYGPGTWLWAGGHSGS